MCHKHLSWAFEMSMGKKKKVAIFPISVIPKVLILHLCDSSENIICWVQAKQFKHTLC